MVNQFFFLFLFFVNYNDVATVKKDTAPAGVILCRESATANHLYGRDYAFVRVSLAKFFSP
jgi:hypothetical protein